MNYNKSRKRKNRYFSKSGSPLPSKMGRRGKKLTSTIDPGTLVKQAKVCQQKEFTPSCTFDEMPLSIKLQSNLRNKGYQFPTQIQQETLDHLLAGNDLVGVAATGTGKTGAFLIPIIERLLENKSNQTSLVVVPTRELALQIEAEFKSLTRKLHLYAVTLIGGTSVGKDLETLRKHHDLIIGTPGRLIDLADRRALKLEKISVLVLDEFDRMLDMGFVNDIKKIIRAMEARRQTMLFSATIDHKQKPLIDKILRNPLQVQVSTGNTASDNVDQDVIRVPNGQDKFDILVNLIGGEECEKVLIFAETKRLVDRVSKKLNRTGVEAEVIHGNKSQNYRTKAINRFKKGQVQVLVATDVAARGIDVADITHVINYQLPLSMESYIHRIGRTGRAGKTGKAFTFVDAA